MKTKTKVPVVVILLVITVLLEICLCILYLTVTRTPSEPAVPEQDSVTRITYERWYQPPEKAEGTGGTTAGGSSVREVSFGDRYKADPLP